MSKNIIKNTKNIKNIQNILKKISNKYFKLI